MNKLCVEIPDGKKAEWVNGVLTLVDNKTKDVRVKTFEDACNELGEDNPLVLQYQCITDNNAEWYGREENDLVSYLKLRIICAALNEGWEPQFTEYELRWYPWFFLYTQEGIDKKNDEWKQKRHLIGTGGYENKYFGFAYAYSLSVPSNSDTYFGSRLCLKSEALATYCGRHFIQLWADFSLIRK